MTESTPRIKLRTSALRAYTMLLALIVIWLFFQWATIDAAHPYGIFLGAINFSKLLQQTAVTGVLAVGMLMVIVSGNIDLSVGAVVGLAGGIAAMSQDRLGLAGCLAAAIIAGLVIGALQGALTAYVNIPSFIVTLGGLQAWRGVILKLSKGATIPVELPFFRSLGRDLVDPRIGFGLALSAIVLIIFTNLRRQRARQRHGLKTISAASMAARIVVPSIVIIAFIILMNKAGGLPIPVIFLLAVALAGAFLTANTTFGRYLYAIGGNPDAARLSGINLKRYILAAFCLMGALAGLASILHTARVGSASPDAGTLMELDAIASCVIGGTSLMGGRGTVFGAVLGALILASLDNGMSLLNVENWAQYVVKGGVLVAAVGFDMYGRSKA
ncbi:MAG TPA: sugar ABC transporter permease [Pyrinomonadaceae bacterium]|jgi:D-xylose transport system permease protein|nr:sugar ABC transporter permease [Pyrinomonadaceae bacterium]